MNKRTKLVLTAVGLAAILVPVFLLITLSSRPQKAPDVSGDKRNIDAKNVQDAAKRVVSPSPSPAPSEQFSTQSASPFDSPSLLPSVSP